MDGSTSGDEGDTFSIDTYDASDAACALLIYLDDIVQDVIHVLEADTAAASKSSVRFDTIARRKWESVVNAFLLFLHNSCWIGELPPALASLIERVMTSSQYAIEHQGMAPSDAIGLELQWIPKERFSSFLPCVHWTFLASPQHIAERDGRLAGLSYQISKRRVGFIVPWVDRMRLLHCDLFLNLLESAPTLPALDRREKGRGEKVLCVHRRLWDIAYRSGNQLKLGEWAGRLTARLLQHAHYERDAIWAFDIDKADTLLSRDWIPRDITDYVLGRSPALLRRVERKMEPHARPAWWQAFDERVADRISQALSAEFVDGLSNTILPEDGTWKGEVNPRSALWYMQSRSDTWIIYFLQCYINRLPPSIPIMLMFGRFLDQLRELFQSRPLVPTIPLDLLPTRFLPSSAEWFCGTIGGMARQSHVHLEPGYWFTRLQQCAPTRNDLVDDIQTLDLLHRACGELGIIFMSFASDALDRAPDDLQVKVMELLQTANNACEDYPSLMDAIPDRRVIPQFWLQKMALRFNLVSLEVWKAEALRTTRSGEGRSSRSVKRAFQSEPVDAPLRKAGQPKDAVVTMQEPDVGPAAGDGGAWHMMDVDDDPMQASSSLSGTQTAFRLEPESVAMDVDSPPPVVPDRVATDGWTTAENAEHDDPMMQTMPETSHRDASATALAQLRVPGKHRPPEEADTTASSAQEERKVQRRGRGVENTTPSTHGVGEHGRWSIVTCKLVPISPLRPVLDDPRRKDQRWKSYYERGPWNVPNRAVRVGATAKEGARGKLPPYTAKMGRSGYRLWMPVMLEKPGDFLAARVRKYGTVLLACSNGAILEVSHGIYRCTRCMQGQGKRGKALDSPWFEFCWRVSGDSCHPCKIKNKTCDFRNDKCDKIAPAIWDHPLVGDKRLPRLPDPKIIEELLGPGLGINEPLPMSKNVKQAQRRKHLLEDEDPLGGCDKEDHRAGVTVDGISELDRRDDGHDDDEHDKAMEVDMPDDNKVYAAEDDDELHISEESDSGGEE